MRRHGLLAAAVAVGVSAAAALAQGPTLPVEDWSKIAVGSTGVPPGWQKQTWGDPKYDFKIEADGNGRVLHMKSVKEGSTISKEVKFDIRQYPVLQWRWKAVTLPKGGDSRKKATDDQACQVYVTFPRFPQQVRSRTIGYVWDTTAPAGTIAPSEKSGTVTYVIMRSGEAELGKWLTETRNVLEDYKKIYGQDPGEQVGAVSVASDSNDTDSSAECFVGEIFFKKP
ncbi:MAG TPA: DUF3047 domain-containing protein [Methylomirabilota bacterium]|nr:DUF3047 domain-containing protein [Methylomirabilota bacterium]